MLQRPADRGRGKRVVDRQQRPVAMRDLGQGRQVRDDARRVGDGLHVEDPGRPRGQGHLDGADIRGVHVRDVDAKPPERRDRLGPRRAVADLADEHPVARAQQRKERGVDRRHAGRERDPRLGPVQLRDRVAERP